jgi:hypothetical protein
MRGKIAMRAMGLCLLAILSLVSASSAVAASATDLLIQLKAVDAQWNGAFHYPHVVDEYSPLLTKSIAGRWFEWSGETRDPAIWKAPDLSQRCGANTPALRSEEPYSFTITYLPGTAHEATLTYTNLGGPRYSVSGDASSLLSLYAEDDRPLKSQVATLGDSLGIATVQLPSPDVLVVFMSNGLGTAFVRCP